MSIETGGCPIRRTWMDPELNKYAGRCTGFRAAAVHFKGTDRSAVPV
jgi:hypothetical protein